MNSTQKQIQPQENATTGTVHVSGLTVRHRRTVALDGIDLDLGPGVHGLLGPNGAGKTSLIRVLATVSRPAAGRVTLLGHELSGHPELTATRRRIGYLPQDFGYYPGFTVRDFVAYVAWLKQVPGGAAGAAVERAVARVGLADRIDAKLKTLSGGTVRRAGIAQAIVNDPDVLLLDEPTAGLDPEQRVAFRELVRELGKEATVIVSTHLVEDVAVACTGVTLLEGGRVVYRGTPESLAVEGAVKTAAEGATRAGGLGGSPVERGYLAVLRHHRAASVGSSSATPRGANR
ncbi:ABC transporter ATP-binding protein [Streptomyces chrestomyceticus JCM 4735]|uniref:ABC transporter ATP-binding protein n=1 Tax=Streptomyces chrestomyceticus JCM 4735 TaxID=1306181 RepID=A0A7U9KVC2_9ACTN|nr:ABC transporter ATP-binding protein [Streptomyces chrestomyceticus]GCD36089.1 ABC transporter ATP-binding protein [Streptomyces chrestomyceticus JCM 4735]